MKIVKYKLEVYKCNNEIECKNILNESKRYTGKNSLNKLET